MEGERHNTKRQGEADGERLAQSLPQLRSDHSRIKVGTGQSLTLLSNKFSGAAAATHPAGRLRAAADAPAIDKVHGYGRKRERRRWRQR